MAQALRDEIKAQPKGMTDVLPYAKQYNFLREKVIAVLGKESEIFLPKLAEDLTKYGRMAAHVTTRMSWFDELSVAISQLVSFLETNLEVSFRILTGLEEFLHNNLRRSIRKTPVEEKEVKDVIEIMLIAKDYVFEREKPEYVTPTRITFPISHLKT